jgi:hypothetical protein
VLKAATGTATTATFKEHINDPFVAETGYFEFLSCWIDGQRVKYLVELMEVVSSR